jgi:hypothetical protein
MKALVSVNKIESKIHLIRGKKVMIDFDLAEMYGVETKKLIQATKRNIQRFPDDFMFQLTDNEHRALRSQIVTSKKGKGGRRYLPYAFTEPGVAMLSSILNSSKAVKVNIEIIRTFIRLREYIQSNKEFAYKLNELESKVSSHDKEIKSIFSAIRQLMKDESKPKRKIGFHID